MTGREPLRHLPSGGGAVALADAARPRWPPCWSPPRPRWPTHAELQLGRLRRAQLARQLHAGLGAWRQPGVSCTRRRPTYSAYWVGLGGYSSDSQALEQIGSEVDCSAAVGSVRASGMSWCPRLAQRSVDAGRPRRPDHRRGHRVRAPASACCSPISPGGEASPHRSASGQIDVTSAEWIVEAPSKCSSASSCPKLPLANFGTTAMTRAAHDHRHRPTARRSATRCGPRRGSPCPPAAGGSSATGRDAGAERRPSGLVFGGTAFAVTYAGPTDRRDRGHLPRPARPRRRRASRASARWRAPAGARPPGPTGRRRTAGRSYTVRTSVLRTSMRGSAMLSA